jgi:hypothetical protein
LTSNSRKPDEEEMTEKGRGREKPACGKLISTNMPGEKDSSGGTVNFRSRYSAVNSCRSTIWEFHT